MIEENTILHGDALNVLKTLPSDSIDCVVTSPPYWSLRDYQVDGQLGVEETPEEYIDTLCNIFDEVKRVLKPTGTCWVNLGDSYSNSGKAGSNKEYQDRHTSFGQVMERGSYGKPTRVKNLPSKCLVGIPARFQLEMIRRGWILRNEIIWHKPNCMPSSVADRFTVDFEKIFFFTKSTDYYFKQQFEPLAESSKIRSKYAWKCDRVNNRSGVDVDVMGDRFVNEKGRNKRCVWKIPPARCKEAHFATFPVELIESPIDAGCPVGSIVLDPFMGAGTTAIVAIKQGKDYLGIELNEEYIDIANKRIERSI